jgi:hypothetical protein
VEGSKEGTGDEVGPDARVSDRFTSEVVTTMHEASLPYIPLQIPNLLEADT